MATILIIDDSTLARGYMKAALDEGEHTIFEAKNGSEGLEKAREVKPDIVMLDLLMPVLDGFGFLEAYRKEEAPAKVIILSADIQESTKTRCIELGAFEFINKPVKKDIVLGAIARALKA